MLLMLFNVFDTQSELFVLLILLIFLSTYLSSSLFIIFLLFPVPLLCKLGLLSELFEDSSNCIFSCNLILSSVICCNLIVMFDNLSNSSFFLQDFNKWRFKS